MNAKLIVPSIAAALIAVGVSACGGSKAAGVTLVPSAGLTEEPSTGTSTTAASSTAPQSATPVASIAPKSGALSKEPTVTIPSGAAPSTLVTKDIITGTGTAAKSGDTLTVNYVGELFKGGKVFDASWKRGTNLEFVLGAGQVISGWDKGLVGMKAGGRRELIIPPSLGYGSTASGSIPANSTLVFVVDLLKVSK